MKLKILFLIIILFIYFFIIFLKKYHIDFYNFNLNYYTKYMNMFNIYELDYINYSIKYSYIEYLINIYFFILSFFNKSYKNILSYLSFSHSIKNNNINSLRFSLGTLYFSKQYYLKAKKIIDYKNINISEIINDDNIYFYGLGWDLKNNHFKIYFRYYDFNKLKNKYKKIILIKNKNLNNNKNYNEDFLKNGILSLTFIKNKLIEEKIYFFKNNDQNAYLFTNKRGKITQESNLNLENKYYYKINKNGKNILNKYNKNNYKLDTINYKNYNQFILYYSL